MPENRLEQQLDALADAPPASPLPPELQAAVGAERRRTVASASIFASLLIASAILVGVALTAHRAEPVIDRGVHEFVRIDAEARPLSVASLRDFDPFAETAFPGEEGSAGVRVQVVRLGPLTAERLDRILAGEL